VVDDNRGVEEALNETTGGMSHYPDWLRSGDGITVTGEFFRAFSLLYSLELRWTTVSCVSLFSCFLC